MTAWTVVYERTDTGWSAFVPALPGVVAAGGSRADTQRLIAEAIAFHLEGMTQDGVPIPDPGATEVGVVEAAPVVTG